MSVQIVMDCRGDSRYFFEPSNTRSLADAEARFKKLIGKGYRAVAPGKSGLPGSLLPQFDVNQEVTVFIPQLQGG